LKVRTCGFLKVVLVLLSVGSSEDANTPQLVYGTYLGGRDKECATGIAVDRSGAAYIAGRTPSPDFPVTPGSFSTTTRVDNNDWTDSSAKSVSVEITCCIRLLLAATFAPLLMQLLLI